MDSSQPSGVFHVAGFHTQLYNELVHPQQVWRVSKYFLRRWSPYLGPTRFWTIVAARQMAYRNRQNDWFDGYDGAVAQEARISKAHYRRIKAEMDEQGSPLALFVAKEETRYHVVNGKTRPKPTRYTVRLDEPLTPADAGHLAHLFQAAELPRRGESISTYLKEAQTGPRHEMLAPHLAPYLSQKPAVYRATTVLDVVEQVFGSHIAQQPEVKRQADALHLYLTEVDFVGRQYFRHQWLPQLKPGPAFLQVYLRSLCYFNEATGELRNRIELNRQTLSDMFDVKANTISDWLKVLERIAPDQALPPFVQLIDKGRASDNSYRFIYDVAMLDPLTAEDHKRYEAAITGQSEFESHESPVSSRSSSENEHHKKGQWGRPLSENDRYKETVSADSQSENETHIIAQSENEPAVSEKESRSIRPASEKASMVEGHDPVLTRPENDYVNSSGRECASFKYYKTLLDLTEKDINTLLTADGAWGDWKVNDAHRPFAEVACKDLNQFYNWIDVDPGGPAREKMSRSGLSLSEMAAWWLYAQQQDRLREPVRLVVARSMAGVKPPKPYLEMAELSWEAWQSFAISRQLPADLRPDWSEDAVYGRWCKLYGDTHPVELPFGVGDQAEMAADWIVAYQATREAAISPKRAASMPHQVAWPAICAVLKQTIDQSLYEIFLFRSAALPQVGEQLTIAVPDETARAFLQTGLHGAIADAIERVMGDATPIEFVVAETKTESTMRSPAEDIPDPEIDPADLWDEVKRELSHQIPKATFDLWVRSAEVARFQDMILTLRVSNDYAKQWLDGRYRTQIERLLQLLNRNQPITIQFEVG